MRLVAFLQLHNELENGNLIRCLENCKQWADDIFIYDDCSTDGSQEIYTRYTRKKNIILGQKRNFKRELFHKQQLLELTLKSKPDWIGWIDGDTTLDRSLTNTCKGFLEWMDKEGYTAGRLHNLNLWRHHAFYRLDNKFNNLWHVVFWKNTGKLSYTPVEKLHKHQYPDGIEESKIFKLAEDKPLIHYGFGTKFRIIKKYLTYKSYGQHGWALDRLIDEQSSYQLNKVPKDWYPMENIPTDYDTATPPSPLTYNEYRKFGSWEEFKKSSEYRKLVQK